MRVVELRVVGVASCSLRVVVMRVVGIRERKTDVVPSTGLSQDVELVTLSSGASTPSKIVKRKRTVSSFATPRKVTQLKRPRTETPPPVTPSSSTPPESPVSSASRKMGSSFLKKEDRAAYEISVRDPQLKEQMVTVSEVRSNLVIDSCVLQHVLSICAVCKICKRGDLKIWELRCEKCGRGEDYWTVSGKFGKRIDIGGKIVSKPNDTVYQSVLARRLIGIGKRGLSIYHAMLGLAQPPLHFNLIEEDLLVAVEFVAKQSMDRAAIELETLHGRSENGLIHDIASFDGAYQKRSSKGGGGYSRYCFGSVISMTIGKILEYDVACNNCRECTRIANMLEDQYMEKEEYDKLVDSHMPQCPAKYRDYSSVCLESELSTVILEQGFLNFFTPCPPLANL